MFKKNEILKLVLLLLWAMLGFLSPLNAQTCQTGSCNDDSCDKVFIYNGLLEKQSELGNGNYTQINLTDNDFIADGSGGHNYSNDGLSIFYKVTGNRITELFISVSPEYRGLYRVKKTTADLTALEKLEIVGVYFFNKNQHFGFFSKSCNLKYLRINYSNLIEWRGEYVQTNFGENLIELDLKGNEISQFGLTKGKPGSQFTFTVRHENLVSLNLDSNRLTYNRIVVEKLPELTEFSVAHNFLGELSLEMFYDAPGSVQPENLFPKLEALDLSHNSISNIPQNIDPGLGVFNSLTTLDLSNNPTLSFLSPDLRTTFPALTSLNVDSTNVQAIPEQWLGTMGATSIALSGNQLCGVYPLAMQDWLTSKQPDWRNEQLCDDLDAARIRVWSDCELGTTTPFGNISIPKEEPYTITAVPNPGYQFDEWMITGDGISVADPKAATTEVIATGDGEVYAVFVGGANQTEMTLTVSGGVPESDVFINPYVGTHNYKVDQFLGLHVYRNRLSPYAFNTWSISDASAIQGTNALTTPRMFVKVPAANFTVDANFVEDSDLKKLKIEIEGSAEITINNEYTLNNDEEHYYYDTDELAFTINPYTFHNFEEWVLNDVDIISGDVTSNSITIKIQSDAIRPSIKAIVPSSVKDLTYNVVDIGSPMVAVPGIIKEDGEPVSLGLGSANLGRALNLVASRNIREPKKFERWDRTIGGILQPSPHEDSILDITVTDDMVLTAVYNDNTNAKEVIITMTTVDPNNESANTGSLGAYGSFYYENGETIPVEFKEGLGYKLKHFEMAPAFGDSVRVEDGKINFEANALASQNYITAVFEKTDYEISLSTTGEGVATSSVDLEERVPHLKRITFRAFRDLKTPNVFQRWIIRDEQNNEIVDPIAAGFEIEGDLNSDRTVSIISKQNFNIEAEFINDPSLIEVTLQTNGLGDIKYQGFEAGVTDKPVTYYVEAGMINIQALLEEGLIFEKWEVAGNIVLVGDTEINPEVTVNGDGSIKAYFKEQYWQVDVNRESGLGDIYVNGELISSGSFSQLMPHGANLSVQAKRRITSNEKFEKWDDNGTTIDTESYSVMVDKDLDLKAFFKTLEDQVKLTVSLSSPGAGSYSVEGQPFDVLNDFYFERDEIVDINLDINMLLEFNSWNVVSGNSVIDEPGNENTTVDLADDTEIVAQIQQDPDLRKITIGELNGPLNQSLLNPTGVVYRSVDEEFGIQLLNVEGYKFIEWLNLTPGLEVSRYEESTNTYYFNVTAGLTGDGTVDGSFEAGQTVAYQLETEGIGEITHSSSINMGQIPYNSKITLTAKRDISTNYVFKEWIVLNENGDVVSPDATGDNSITFNAIEDLSIKAVFEEGEVNSFNVISNEATVSINGELVDFGAEVFKTYYFEEGEAISIQLTEKIGFKFDEWETTLGLDPEDIGSKLLAIQMPNEEVYIRPIVSSFVHTITLENFDETRGNVKPEFPPSNTIQCDHGEVIHFEAMRKLDTNFDFVKWDVSGEDPVFNPTWDFSCTRTVSIEPIFETDNFLNEVEIISNPNGNYLLNGQSISGGDYFLKDRNELLVSPNNGFEFDNWSPTGGVSPVSATSNPLVFDVSSNGSIEVNLSARTPVNITVSSNSPNGSVNPEGQTTHDYGAMVQLRADRNVLTDFEFSNWTGIDPSHIVDGELTDDRITIRVVSDMNIVANFVQNTSLYQINLSKTGTEGKIFLDGAELDLTNTISMYYSEGTVLPLSVTEEGEHQFIEWTVDQSRIEISENTKTPVIRVAEGVENTPANLVVNFDARRYNLIVENPEPDLGELSPIGTSERAYKELVTISFVDNFGGTKNLVDWTVEPIEALKSGNTGTSIDIEMIEEVKVTPNFEDQTSELVKVNYSVHIEGDDAKQTEFGFIKANTVPLEFNEDNFFYHDPNVSLAISGDEVVGYKFSHWNVQGATLVGSNIDATITNLIPGNVTLKMFVEKMDYTLNINVMGEGNVLPGADPISIPYKAKVNISAFRDEASNHKFNGWSGFTFTDPNLGEQIVEMNSDVNVTANFEYDPSLLKVTLGKTPLGYGGNLNFEGDHYFYDGETFTVRVHPQVGYDFVGWDNPGNVGITAVSENVFEFTLNSTTANSIVTAQFQQTDFDVTIIENALGHVEYNSAAISGVSTFRANTELVLNAVPANPQAHYLKEWLVGVDGNTPEVVDNPTLTISVDGNLSIEPVFELIAEEKTIIVENSPYAVISQTPQNDDHLYALGAKINLQVQPNVFSNKRFVKWVIDNETLDDVENASPQMLIEVLDNAHITPVLEDGDYAVVSIESNMDVEIELLGNTITLTSTPQTLYLPKEDVAVAIPQLQGLIFKGWDVVGEGIKLVNENNSDALSVFNISDDGTLRLKLEEKAWNLNVAKNGNGFTSPTVGGPYPTENNELLSLVATRDYREPFIFDSWNITPVPIITFQSTLGDTLEVLMDKDLTATADFNDRTADMHLVSIEPAEENTGVIWVNGQEMNDASEFYFLDGEIVEIRGEGKGFYSFKEWIIEDGSEGNVVIGNLKSPQTSLTITGPASIKASFEVNLIKVAGSCQVFDPGEECHTGYDIGPDFKNVLITNTQNEIYFLLEMCSDVNNVFEIPQYILLDYKTGGNNDGFDVRYKIGFNRFGVEGVSTTTAISREIWNGTAWIYDNEYVFSGEQGTDTQIQINVQDEVLPDPLDEYPQPQVIPANTLYEIKVEIPQADFNFQEIRWNIHASHDPNDDLTGEAKTYQTKELSKFIIIDGKTCDWKGETCL